METRPFSRDSLRNLLGFEVSAQLLSPAHVRAGLRRRREDLAELRRRERLLRDFDPVFYGHAYEDLANLSGAELVGHWLGGGAAEGRIASASQLPRECPHVDWQSFSPADFLLANPDLGDLSHAAASVYMARYGYREERPLSIDPAVRDLIGIVAVQVLGPSAPARSKTSWRGLFDAVDDVVGGGFTPEIEDILADPDDRRMIVRLVELIHGRVPAPVEVDMWIAMIPRRGRPMIMTSVVRFLARDPESQRLRLGDRYVEAEPPRPADQIHILGDYESVVSFSEWHKRRSRFRASQKVQDDLLPVVQAGADPVVTVICSLYRGGALIEPYLENITGQIGFDRHELVIIDAASPEGEEEVIRAYVERFPNIRYHRQGERISIYEAWNLGIEASRGRYLTNANLDDARHLRSLDDMAAFLDAHGDIDVVYADTYYTLEPHAPWDVVEHVGVRTDLPPMTTWNVLQFNSPHCAPMWRRRLHAELGDFDTAYLSSGDWDFWIRCAEAGYSFHKLPDPLIAYYLNPDGMSTRPDSPGIREQWPIRERYRELLLQPERSLDPLRGMGPA